MRSVISKHLKRFPNNGLDAHGFSMNIHTQ